MSLTFVVEQHESSPLHYDFRLSIGKLLRSWAIPQGPSMDPQDKRVAVELETPVYVQDSVHIWDKGTYKLEGIPQKKLDEKTIKHELRKGKVSLVLHGKKLKGAFTLVWTKGQNWLMWKKEEAGK